MKTPLYYYSTILATGMVLLTSVTTLAQEGGATSHPELLAKPETAIPAMIGALVMFVILYFSLKKTVWAMIIKGLQDREIKIRTEIESAENARTQANAALAEYQKELSKARTEANEMIAQAKSDAQRVADELRSKNEIELNSMKDKAKGEIEAAKRSALTELYNQTATLATMVAGKILQREINIKDHENLVADSIKQLQSLESDNNKNNN